MTFGILKEGENSVARFERSLEDLLSKVFDSFYYLFYVIYLNT